MRQGKLVAGVGLGWLTAGGIWLVAEVVRTTDSPYAIAQAVLAFLLIWAGMAVLLLVASAKPPEQRASTDDLIRWLADERTRWQAQIATIEEDEAQCNWI